MLLRKALILQRDQILKVHSYSRKPQLTQVETTAYKRPLCCALAHTKLICILGSGKLCSAKCSTALISHSATWEHVTTPTLPSSWQIPAFHHKVTLTNMRRKHRLESLNNQDALRDEHRSIKSFIYTPDLDFISLYGNNSTSSLNIAQEVFLQKGAELLQQQLYTCCDLLVTANSYMMVNSIQSVTPSHIWPDHCQIAWLGHRKGLQREKPPGIRFAIQTRLCDWDKNETTKSTKRKP